MPHRDPETGQFLSTDDAMSFDDIEVASFSATVGVQASNLTGDTSFTGASDDYEGLEVLDYDEIVDRNEELHLLSAHHRATVYVNATETADGSVVGSVEVSASPALSDVTARAAKPGALATDPDGDDVVGEAATDDTIDIIGRPLVSNANAPFSDGASGVGGGGSSGDDSYDNDGFPMEYGRFHPRDELYVNGRLTVNNIDDAGVHISISGQHVYGVMAD